MRAFVTGATGFVGSHLVRALVARGDSVVALARDPKKAALLPPQVEIRLGDLADDDALRAVRGPFDAIFHLGAAISGDWSYHRRVTVEGTRRLVHMASESGLARLVLVSSLAVYDKQLLTPRDTITESSALFSSVEDGGPYAWGKIEAERLVAEAAAKAAIEYVVARPGLIYGPGHLFFAHLGPKLAGFHLAIGGSSVRLPLVHIDSVVHALIKMAETPGLSGRAFNIVDEEQPSKATYLRELSRARGKRTRCIGIPAAPFITTANAIAKLKAGGRASFLPAPSPKKIRSRTVECRYDCSALRQSLGWKPAHTLEQGLACSLKPLPVRDPVALQRVGLIGAGRMAEFHLAALKDVPGVQVTGILDTNIEAASAVAGRHRIPFATSDAESFYTEARPDIVHILTPPQSHAALALEAIDRGCHVLLEKPMVLRVEEADEIAEAARAKGVTVGVDHNFVPDPRIGRARSLIASGAIGELVHVEIAWSFDIRRFSHALPKNEHDTTWAMELPARLLEDLLPHPLSIALALVNEDVRLRSWHAFRSGRLPYACDDEVRLLLAGRHCTAALSASLTAKPDDLIITVYGTRATLRIDVNNMTFVRGALMKGPKAVARGLCLVSANLSALAQTCRNVLLLAARRAQPPASVAHLIRQHYAAMRNRTPLPASVEDGRRIVEIMRTIWPCATSAEIRRPRPMLNTSPEDRQVEPVGEVDSTLVPVGPRLGDGSHV